MFDWGLVRELSKSKWTVFFVHPEDYHDNHYAVVKPPQKKQRSLSSLFQIQMLLFCIWLVTDHGAMAPWSWFSGLSRSTENASKIRSWTIPGSSIRRFCAPHWGVTNNFFGEAPPTKRRGMSCKLAQAWTSLTANGYPWRGPPNLLWFHCRWHQAASHGWHMGLSEHSGVPRIPVEGTLRSTGHDGGTGILKHTWQLIGDGGSYCFTIAIIPT